MSSSFLSRTSAVDVMFKATSSDDQGIQIAGPEGGRGSLGETLPGVNVEIEAPTRSAHLLRKNESFMALSISLLSIANT